MGQAGDEAKEARIQKRNDRDSGQWFKKTRPRPERENHVWLRAKHITCQLHRRSLGGISLHDQVSSLDISEPTKFVEERSNVSKTAGFGDLRYRDGNCNIGNAIDLRGLLGPCRSQAGCDQQTGYELPPLHSITSSARASSVGETVRPSTFAVFKLMTSSYLVGAWTGRLAGFSPLRMRSA